MLALILAVGMLLCAWLVMRVAAGRYEARQRRLVKWDEYGPLVETEGPPKGPSMSGNMSERTEVAGEWHGEVLRRRRPHEKP